MFSYIIRLLKNKHILNDTFDQIRKEKSALTKYRIMSFDGGGTLGALSLQLLNRLVQQNPKLISRTNVFSGNSIGSFTALALASGRSPKETLQFLRIKSCRHSAFPDKADLFLTNNYHIPVSLKRYKHFFHQIFSSKT